MDAVFKKLNFKEQSAVLVLNAPASFDINLDSIANETKIFKDLTGIDSVAFCMVFATQQKEIDEIIPMLAPLFKGDVILWMCYPKGTSKKYKCDFNRDTGWKILGDFDLEPVRMVAIDEDWSALRFKKVDYIKTMKRSSLGALSEKGKIKANQ